MATWRFTTLAAAALVLLAAVETVVCVDDPDPNCNVTKAASCYWSQAHDYGVNALKPTAGKMEEFLKNICVPEKQLPEASKCTEFYGKCPEEEKEWFLDQEEGYRQLREKVTDPIMCKIVDRLLTCIDGSLLLHCPAEFANEYTPDNAQKNDNSAKTLKMCLKNALASCQAKDQTAFKEYLGAIAEAVSKLYKYKTLPPGPATSTASPITTDASTTPATPESTTQETTTHQPITQETTTHQPITQSTTDQPSTLPPTTPAPPSGGPSVHAVGVFGFLALAVLARGA